MIVAYNPASVITPFSGVRQVFIEKQAVRGRRKASATKTPPDQGFGANHLCLSFLRIKCGLSNGSGAGREWEGLQCTAVARY